MESKKSEKEMLERILSTHELEVLTKAYSMLNNIENKEFEKALLRRIEDVISMIRYIEISYPFFNQDDYDALGSRMTNLEITMTSIEQPESKQKSFNYLADETGTPLILRTIEYLDNQRFYEVGDLLSSIAEGKVKGIPVEKELKLAKGESKGILYLKKDGQVLIYDIVSITRTKKPKIELKDIKNRCLEALEKGLDPTIQSIYDQMVYQALNFNIPEQGNGYALTKKRDNEI